VSGEHQAEADALRGVLRVNVGGEERRIRKLKLHPAEEWFERNAKALGPIASIDPETVEGDLEAAARLMGEFSGALLTAIAEYDTENVLGGVEGIGNEIYPDELLPLFLALRDAALPFVDLLRDHKDPASGVSVPRSSMSALSPSGASTPTPSASDSTPAN